MAALSYKRIRRGFTLAELLVVMGIITILAAVIVPAAIQSRNRARSAACVANFKQIGGAISLYAQDWSDHLPYLRGGPCPGTWPTERYPDGTSATCLRFLLSSRLAAADSFRCANDVGAPQYGFAQVDGPVFKRTGSSYLPWSTARPGRCAAGCNGLLLQLTVSRKACLLCDYGADWHGIRTREGLDLLSAAVANALFADGHAGRIEVFSIGSTRGSYIGMLAGAGSPDSPVRIAGKCGYGYLEVNGNATFVGAPGQSPATLRISVSGEVVTEDGHYEVEKVFSFPNTASIEHAVRQVVISLEAAYAD